MPLSSRTARLMLLALAALVHPVGAPAQSYPDKPIHIVVPYPPGGGADILARAVGPKLAERLSQQVIVDNKPGAGASIGTEAMARASADGHTLLVASPSHSINATLYPDLHFDAERDFTAVTLLASGPLVLVAGSTFPASTVRGLVALARSTPGGINYASAGSGSSPHLAAELFKSMAGVQLTHVPYKGTAPALTDLLGGQVHVMFAPLPTVQAHLKSGRLKALAVTTASRFAALREAPTVAEAGVPGYEVLQWWGLVAPAGTPKHAIAKLNAEVAGILQAPDMRERLAAMGAEPGGGSPEQFAALIHDERVKWAQVIRAAGVVAD